MQIIISPAKQMRVDTDSIESGERPLFLEETKKLLNRLRTFNREELRELFRANEKITEENFQRYSCMNPENGRTPALLSYVGLQYQYMAPQVFTGEQWEYVKKHLWILSGYYGMLRPAHGVTPERLERQARLSVGETKDLYAFWGDRLYRELVREDRVILNLASREYSKAIEKYLQPEDRFLTVVFGELYQGKIRQKGTLAKMARGEMVRFLAENQIGRPEDMREFHQLGFAFSEELSEDERYVFIRKG